MNYTIQYTKHSIKNLRKKEKTYMLTSNQYYPIFYKKN